jgi:hypothetical protein
MQLPDPPVHLASYASQPAVVLRCASRLVPSVPGPAPETKIFIATDGTRYTFDDTRTTCASCRAAK